MPGRGHAGLRTAQSGRSTQDGGQPSVTRTHVRDAASVRAPCGVPSGGRHGLPQHEGPPPAACTAAGHLHADLQPVSEGSTQTLACSRPLSRSSTLWGPIRAHQARLLLLPSPSPAPAHPPPSLITAPGTDDKAGLPPITSPRRGAPAESAGCASHFYSEHGGHVTLAAERLVCSICRDLFDGPEYGLCC